MAHDKGIPVHVWVDETRPRNQGASLTAFELGQHGVPHTVIPDNTGGHLMQHGQVDMVIFRENTEDVYAGLELPSGSDEARRLIEHLRSTYGWDIKADSGIGIKPMSESGSKRLVRAAIRSALENGRRSVTLVHKGNIMKFTEGAFRIWGYEVVKDEFMFLGPAGGISLPNVAFPKLMSNHGNFVGSLSNVTKYLGRKAEELGVEIYPGFPAAEILYDEAGAVVGIATGDLGVARSGEARDDFTRGMELRAKYTVFGEVVKGMEVADKIVNLPRNARDLPAERVEITVAVE